MFSNQRAPLVTRQAGAVGDVAERAVPALGGPVARRSTPPDAGAVPAGSASGPRVVP